MTKITKAQKQLEQVANDLKQVIEQANAPILGVDTEGRINEWNRKAAQITGFEKIEVRAESPAPRSMPPQTNCQCDASRLDVAHTRNPRVRRPLTVHLALAALAVTPILR